MEEVQDMPDYDRYTGAAGTRVTVRGTKGNRLEQQRRYRARKPTKYRIYMRDYMRVRRAAVARVLTDDV